MAATKGVQPIGQQSAILVLINSGTLCDKDFFKEAALIRTNAKKWSMVESCAKGKEVSAQLDTLNFFSAGMRDLRISAEHAYPAETAINF